MRSWRPICLLNLGIVVVVSVTACNRERLPGLGSVSGTVTMDGQPVADATITFDGAKPGEPVSLGRTDASGKYDLYYSRSHKGATVGEHVVHITTYGETEDEGNRQVHKETVPARYNFKSELKVNVKRGSNKLDFALDSRGDIVQPGEDDSKKGKGKGKRGK
jgi:hypothetical protein